MSTINNNDLFIVSRSGTNYRVTAADVAAYAGAGATFGLGLNVTGGIVKVSIPVASTPPAAGAGAAQAINGSLYWDDTLTQLFIRYNNGGSPVWVAAAPSAGGGGGSGTVTNVTGTLPIAVATGTSTPVVSINQGLGVATNGNFLVTKVTEATTPPAAGTGAAQAVIGSTYYDTNLGAMFIYYSNGGTPTWVMV